MAKKVRVGVLFGGRSGEHEVSLLSAASVLKNIDKKKYDVVPIGITKDGRWVTSGHAEQLLRGEHKDSERNLRAGDPDYTESAAVLAKGESVLVPPVPSSESGSLIPFESDSNRQLGRAGDHLISVDIIFPVLHGTFGEDGTIQGLLELADIAYVGAGVLGSAAGMDKDVMKRLFAAAGLPIVKHVTVLAQRVGKRSRRSSQAAREETQVSLLREAGKSRQLGRNQQGSQSRRTRRRHVRSREVRSQDRRRRRRRRHGKKKRRAREIECSVLGNDDPKSSVPGEIVPSTEFYDYAAKYLDEGSRLVIPAKLSKKDSKRVQKLAVDAFQAVDCSGLGRVDFLMDPDTDRIYVNEINTMPGFTAISMYPKLWEATGIKYAELIDRLIQLGFERHQDKKRNRYTRD